MTMTSTDGSRKRRPIACDACRMRKKRCDGESPCSDCRTYDYECYYRDVPRKRKSKKRQLLLLKHGHMDDEDLKPEAQEAQQLMTPKSPQALQSTHSQNRSQDTFNQAIESNSGATFARTLINSLDPAQSISPLRILAWNLYLGGRQSLVTPDVSRHIATIITKDQMELFVAVYVAKLQPCYGFIDEESLPELIAEHWQSQNSRISGTSEALLCGIAALASLFSSSTDLPTELQLVARAKQLLDPSVAESPSLNSSTAWLLRTVYLRLTAKPDEAWMASCTTLHVVDAARLTFLARGDGETAENSRESRFGIRVLGIAQHLNTWISYDLGRRRVDLHFTGEVPDSNRPGEYLNEVIELLPLAHDLDPAKELSNDSLAASLVKVLARQHSQPPSVLAQCNLMLCIYRRLHGSRAIIPESIMNDVLHLLRRALEAARSCIAIGLPWHHVANIPFQIVCTLMAIDTAESLLLLGDAMDCIITVNNAYNTEATQEATNVASSLLRLHRVRREAEIRRHSDLLKLYPDTFSTDELSTSDDFFGGQELLDSWWTNEFGTFSGVDFNQLLQSNPG